MKSNNTLLTLADYAAAARAVLPVMAWEYLASGVADDWTLRENRRALARFEIVPRVLVDVSHLDTTMTLFGRKHEFPVLLAPTGYHKLIHPAGELETIRGANAASTTLIASCFATVAFEKIREASTHPLWFQLYVQKDRGHTRDLIQRVIDAGCEAICITVDLPVNGPRDRESRAGFTLPAGITRENLIGLGAEVAASSHRVVDEGIYNPTRAANLTWKDLEWLRSIISVPLLLKGILRPEDAENTRKAGCDGVIVSNHGGRSMDGVPAAITMLPEIAARVDASMTVIMDGGIRRGTDVVKAMALGAKAVLIGKPYLHGLAVNGAEGVTRVIQILQTEFRMAMAMSGARQLSEITRDLIRRSPRLPVKS